MLDTFIIKVRDINPTRKIDNLDRRLIKVGEELGEVMEAYLNVTSTHNQKNKTWADVHEELIDTAIVIMDVALTINPTITIPTTYMATSITSDTIRALTVTYGEINHDFIRGDMNRFVDMCTSMFKLLIGMAMSIEGDIITELDRKLAKWTTNMKKMPTTIDDDV